ncbi:hypothetical protein GCM10011444_12740 [Winogradskyella haliclonae]|uniref:Thioredoxin domain-containing protein n=2 Tax=Winogradskyella haliclonae TaxID=2048558 RepID=A0ABQ2BWZ4_9FLAO|nr:hypothetical protein GCM10011444_12740 [Winogradskyella haliclonae]
MNFLTLDLRIVSFLVALLIGTYAVLKRNKSKAKIILVVLSCLPISIGYILGILPEIPKLWTAIPLFLMISAICVFDAKKWVSGIGLLLIVFYSFGVVPNLVESSLSQYVNENAPEIKFKALHDGKTYSIEDFKDKTLVIDFFGTWCKPCIEEMKELKALKENYSARTDIEFLFVCTQFGKDTPEKAKKFLEARNFNFKGYFDEDNVAHKQLKFTGVPALVIVNKKGKVVFKHEGYNPSENLTAIIKKVID